MSAPVPICPKCGYDQTGIIDSWAGSCPLGGSCAECGQRFAWRDVFDPVLNDLPWYGEHAKTLRGMVTRTPGTLGRLVLPWLYWRRVGVEKRVSLRGLAAWLIVFALGLHLLVSVVFGAGHWHQLSLGVYGTLGNLYQVGGLKGLCIPVINAVGSPFVEASYNWRTSSLMLHFLILNQHVARHAFTPMFPFFGMTLVWTLIMLAVPTTRRHAKIRAAHVLRAALMSTIVLLLAFELGRAAQGLDDLMTTPPIFSNIWARRYGGIVMPLLIIWMPLFWGSAVIMGWRVRPCGLLVVLGSIAALIGSLSATHVLLWACGWLS